MSLRVDILTLFPEMFEAFRTTSIVGRAVKRDLATIAVTNIRDFAKDALFLRTAAECAEFAALPVLELAAARALSDLEPDDAENQYRLAKAAALNNDKPLCIAAARRAIELGGLPMREGLGKTEVFERYRVDSEFQALLRPPGAGLK